MAYRSDSINEIALALSKAQRAMRGAAKDSNNPAFNSKYADLSSVIDAIREHLSDHEIAFTQSLDTDENKDLFLETLLIHSSGQWLGSKVQCKVIPPSTPDLDRYGKPKKFNEVQALGSLITYLRRYSLSSITGIAPDEDDDANIHSHEFVEPTQQPKKTVPFVLKDQEKVKPATITKEQADALTAVLKDCDDEFKQTIRNFINMHCNGSINEIPIGTYPKLLTDATTKKNTFAPILAERRKLEAMTASEMSEAVNE